MGKVKTGFKMWAPVVLLRYWLFQSMLYMNWIERLHRVIIEIVLCLLAFFVLAFFLNGLWQLLLALIIGHTLSMIFNGHLFALFKHDLYWFGFYKRWADFAAYVDIMQRRFVQRPCKGLASAEIYGSITRGTFSPYSDLDIRLIAKPGWLNAWSVCNRVLGERLRALFRGFPIDIYMFRSTDEAARKMNLLKEKPIIIYSTKNPADTVPFHQRVIYPNL